MIMSFFSAVLMTAFVDLLFRNFADYTYFMQLMVFQLVMILLKYSMVNFKIKFIGDFQFDVSFN